MNIDLKQRLQTLRNQRRLPPVLLLEGHSTTLLDATAQFVAQLYLCDHGRACGQCTSCREVASERHPDLYWVAPTDAQIKLETAAEIQDHLSFQPGQQLHDWPSRIAVINACERLNLQAANRLLKTLEEPAAASRVILTTAHRKALLPTIQSRCVRFFVPETVTERPTIIPDEQYNQLKLLINSTNEENTAAVLAAAEDLAKNFKISAFELARKMEIVLNEMYRQGQDTGTLLQRNKRRQVLRRLKQNRTIRFNATLAGEALGLGS